LRCAGVLMCMTSRAAGMVPSGEATLAGAPPTARHWLPGQPHVVEPCRPHRACSGHQGDITSSQPTFRDYINTSPTTPRARTPSPELHRPPLPLPWLARALPPSPLPLSLLGYCLGASEAK
jgi:hypothetical protein